MVLSRKIKSGFDIKTIPPHSLASWSSPVPLPEPRPQSHSKTYSSSCSTATTSNSLQILGSKLFTAAQARPSTKLACSATTSFNSFSLSSLLVSCASCKIPDANAVFLYSSTLFMIIWRCCVLSAGPSFNSDSKIPCTTIPVANGKDCCFLLTPKPLTEEYCKNLAL